MKETLIIDGKLYVHTPEAKKERRTVWVEFDFNSNKPRAVADSYNEIELSWAKERRELGSRYLRNYSEVERGEIIVNRMDVVNAWGNMGEGTLKEWLRVLGLE